jgi:hypothetical protein
LLLFSNNAPHSNIYTQDSMTLGVRALLHHFWHFWQFAPQTLEFTGGRRQKIVWSGRRHIAA